MSRTPTDYYCEESIRKIMLSCNVCITCRKGLGVILSHQIVQLSFFIPIYMTVTVCRMIWEDSWYWYCTLWLRQAESGTITIHQDPVIMAFSGGPEEHIKPVQKRPEAKMLHEKKNFTIEKMAKFYPMNRHSHVWYRLIERLCFTRCFYTPCSGQVLVR